MRRGDVEYGAYMARCLERLALRCESLPEGERRAMLARKRRELIEGGRDLLVKVPGEAQLMTANRRA
jgi:hypothetical protein